MSRNLFGMKRSGTTSVGMKSKRLIKYHLMLNPNDHQIENQILREEGENWNGDHSGTGDADDLNEVHEVSDQYFKECTGLYQYLREDKNMFIKK